MTPHSYFQMGDRSERGLGQPTHIFKFIHLSWLCVKWKFTDTHQLQRTETECYSTLSVPQFHKVWVYRIKPYSTSRIRIKQGSVSLNIPYDNHFVITNPNPWFRLSEGQSWEEALSDRRGTSQDAAIVESHHIWLLFHVNQPTWLSDLFLWFHECTN